MGALVIGLRDFGLTLETLCHLGDRPVQLGVSFAWPEPSGALVKLKPADRLAEMNRRKREGLRRARSQWPDCGMKARGSERAPHGFEITLPARQVGAIAREVSYDLVTVEGIQGRKPRRRPYKAMMEWYAVRGRVAIQIEGQTKGLQTVEDRVVLVKALDFDDAVGRLKREWSAYARPYLNRRGQLVRWQLEEVVDVYSITETELDPKGVEVYSKLTNRRMRRSREWHPQRGQTARKKNGA